MSLTTLLLLYLAFRFKQLACDFLFQTSWMAYGKGLPGREGYRALFSHTAIHAIGTLIITLVFAPMFWWLSLVDLILHSVVDRVKAVLTREKKWDVKDAPFWWAFGIDQEIHNLTHVAYIALIYTSLT